MITIASIEQTDLEQLADLYTKLVGTETNRSSMQAMYEKISANPDYILIGAKDENQQLLGSLMGIVCTDLVGDCRPFMVIENVIVSEKSRRQGVGKLLMSYIEEQGRERNCYYTMLVSLIERKEAHIFYESIGYAKGVVRGFKKYL